MAMSGRHRAWASRYAVEHGQITRLQIYSDRAQACGAAGLWE